MATRLKDIAEALNISISTVSYALNGGPRSVPDEVRDRVRTVAHDMGYRPNRLARSLAAGKTMTLGVVPVVSCDDFIANPYFQDCFAGVVSQAKSLDFDVLLYTHDALNLFRLGDVIMDGRVDGLVFLAPFKELSVLDRVRDEGIPFSLISGAHHGSAPAFRCDNAGGMLRAFEHLVGLGHERIAHFCGDVTMIDGSERLDGFLASAEAFGVDVPRNWITCGAFATSRGHACAMELLSHPDRPSAIICASDEIAVGVYRAAQELGIVIPDELSVIGFDDSKAALLATPQLTSVRQPLEDMGRSATRAVTDIIAGRDVTGLVFATDLVIRQSTARPKEVIL